MNFIVKTFENLVKYIKKYGFVTVIQAMLLVILMLFVYLTISLTDVKNIIKIQPIELLDLQKREHIEKNNKRFQISSDILSILNTSIEMMPGIDRVIVGEYHNGSENLAGLPFMKFTITYEIDRPYDTKENSSLYPSFQNINASIYKFVDYIYKNGQFSGNIDDIRKIDNNLYKTFKEKDVKYAYIYNIKYDKNNNLGFICLTSCNPISNEEILYVLNIVDDIRYSLSLQNSENKIKR